MSPLNSLQEPSRYSICNQPHSAKWWAPLCGHYCSRIYCSKTTGILKAIISLYLVLQIIFIQSPVHSLNIVCFYLGYLLVLFYGFFVCLLACFFFQSYFSCPYWNWKWSREQSYLHSRAHYNHWLEQSLPLLRFLLTRHPHSLFSLHINVFAVSD